MDPQTKPSIMDAVKNFEDALRVYEEKVRPLTEGEKNLLNSTDESLISERHHLRLRIIIEVINEGWEADAMNSSQWKYYPRFYNNSGVGLSYGGCGYWCATTSVGPRLCLETYEKAEYVGTQFLDEYKGFFNCK